MPAPLTFLCIATYEKGHAFLRECKRQGCRVLLLTLDTLSQAGWPREAIDEMFFITRGLPEADLLKAVSYVARTRVVDGIVALDDLDVEMGAVLREHLRLPGMGETTARHFRDKLAMRARARSSGILVPEFLHLLNDSQIEEFSRRVAPPWLVKPRSQAAAVGIKKAADAGELRRICDELGDNRSFYVLEQFVPGDVYHVDSIVSERRVVFAVPHKYSHPPLDVSHHGGIFMTRTLAPDAPETAELEALNQRMLESLGLVRGVTHSEFIRAHSDGRLYFLETSARVGGANIAEVIEAATGINLWVEWARIEIAGEQGSYKVPPHTRRFAGIVLTLAAQEHPDTSAYADPEIVLRIKKNHHAGLIVASDDARRVEQLQADYSRRFYQDFYATKPPPERLG